MIQIPITLLDPRCRPERKTAGAVGYDLVARERSVIHANHVVKVPLGVRIALEPGYEAQVRPRSGLTLKGIFVHLGTIDHDYRGELCAIASALNVRTIEQYDRIAQLVIQKIPDSEFRVVPADQLGDTARGEQGFGSTGVAASAHACPACGLIFERNAPCLACGVCGDCHTRNPQKHEYRRR